ncbi:hypothetical protein Goklo_022872 [Gossypium klotzschianum]|uniref:RNase H type-1 domain-containing protein n=1 Tax=Gossypium klotzschianum TaxID=34286 RepID=A0A7J8TNZ7_9ROSI|nr:hypothetical protein [Gossypium klotzschianum]
MGCPLSSMIAGDGSWNLDLLRLWVLEEVINKIVGVPPPHPSSGPNKIVWGATSTGSFSLKCAYGKIRGGAIGWIGHVSLGLLLGVFERTITYFSRLFLELRKAGSWVRLRTDGPVRLDEGFATTGGFVGDHNDGWIMGFCRYLGNCTVLEAKLWGILDGLNFILDRRFERVLIQTDSIKAVNTIQKCSSGNFNSALVTRIHHILAQMKQWKIHHISRKENFIVDSLANSIRSRRLGLRLVEYPLINSKFY